MQSEAVSPARPSHAASSFPASSLAPISSPCTTSPAWALFALYEHRYKWGQLVWLWPWPCPRWGGDGAAVLVRLS